MGIPLITRLAAAPAVGEESRPYALAPDGVVTVRFETRTSGPGPAVTLPIGDADLRPADPLASLDWPDHGDDPSPPPAAGGGAGLA